MAIKTTIRITKGTSSYTLWTLDGVTYGPEEKVPNWGLTAPAASLAYQVSGNPGALTDRLEFTMKGGAKITCQRLAASPHFFLWSMDGNTVAINTPGAADILPVEFFNELKSVSGFAEIEATIAGPSRIEIVHEDDGTLYKI